MDAEKCHELNVKNAEIIGMITTQRQRIDSMSERLDEIIQDVNYLKHDTVRTNSFDKLTSDVSEIRNNQVSMPYMTLFMNEVRIANESAASNFKQLKKWSKAGAITIVIMLILLIGELILVLGADTVPYLSKIVTFIFKLFI